MPDISSIGNSPIGPLNRSSPAPYTNGALRHDGSAAAGDSDRVDLSEQALSLDRSGTGIRPGRIAEVRQLIAEGHYETEERLNLAIDRLLEDLGHDGTGRI